MLTRTLMSSPKPVKRLLPYLPDSARLFAPLAHQPWSMLLDSAYHGNQTGRFDILVAEPVCTLQTWGLLTLIERDGRVRRSFDDPLSLLQQQLGPQREAVQELPFCGGALGYLAYDLGRRFEHLPECAQNREALPDMAVGIYDWAVVIDHQHACSWLVGYGLDEAQIEDLVARFSQYRDAEPSEPFRVLAEPQANMSEAQYTQAFARIKHYLQEGDCYQVNLTQRFSSPCSGDPWQAYQVLRQINAAPFSAYLHVPDAQILSSSPERFLRVCRGHVETKPIKGTRPRSENPREDREYMHELAASSKDRAENVMIVDLLRNDIGRSCSPGSVAVPELFAVESYATVHHLVSTVVGELSPQRHALDLMRSCFPGGSITGAPKIRAMQIIEELEPHRRGVYCGAIAYIGYDGNMDSNIAIRTLVHNQGEMRFWAGGGIVFDSVAAAEYQECFDKGAALLELLRRFRT
jgi:para-aminobenzoate synthetase component I